MRGRTCSSGGGGSWTIGPRRWTARKVFLHRNLQISVWSFPLNLSLVPNRMSAGRKHHP